MAGRLALQDGIAGSGAVWLSLDILRFSVYVIPQFFRIFFLRQYAHLAGFSANSSKSSTYAESRQKKCGTKKIFTDIKA